MHIRGDHAELVVGGRLDVRSAADARTVLHSAVDDGAGDLVLDLTELDSWDATGLGVIMGAHRRAGRCGRRLVLRDVPPADAAIAGRHPTAPHSGDRGRNRRGITAPRVTERGDCTYRTPRVILLRAVMSWTTGRPPGGHGY